MVRPVRVAIYVLEPLVLAGTHITGPPRHIRRDRSPTLLAVLYLQRVLRGAGLVDISQLRGNLCTNQPVSRVEAERSRDDLIYALRLTKMTAELFAQSSEAANVDL